MGWGHRISILKDLANIAFFALTGLLALLTYVRARKTILQPFRTEVFKEQLKVLGQILARFAGKEEFELRLDSGLEELLKLNVSSFADDYATIGLGLTIDRSKRAYSACRNSIVNQEELELVTGPYVDTGGERPLIKWTAYKRGHIYLPESFAKATRELETLAGTPLLPSQLIGLLRQYIATVRHNAVELMDVLSSCGSDMARHYPTLDALKNAEYAWITRKYRERFTNLKPHADAIFGFVGTYCDSDRIFKV